MSDVLFRSGVVADAWIAYDCFRFKRAKAPVQTFTGLVSGILRCVLAFLVSFID